MGSMSYKPLPYLKPSMCFIDGYYLRKNAMDIFKNDNIDLEKLHRECAALLTEDMIASEFMRIYYYDAIVDPSHKDYQKQKSYFERIDLLDHYEVKLGELIELRNGKFRQKGVDVFLSIDMLKKAYQNQYEWAVLVAGDGDYVEVVKAVKEAGKRVYGFYFEEHISPTLKTVLDRRFILDKDPKLVTVLKQ